MGRTDDPQEFEYDQHGVEAVDHENQPIEMTINYNNDQQASYNTSNPTEPQTNLVQEQYPPPQQQNPAQFPPPQQQNPAQFPPPQQQNPAQYPPPQQNPQMGTQPPNYPPKGSTMQYPQGRSPQPMQFPPPQSQQAPQPTYQPQANYNVGPAAQYGGPQYAPPPVPQNYGSPMPQSPYKPASGVPMPNQFPNAMTQIGTEPWRTGLFDCMDDPQSAIITACFPCVTFGQIAEIIDNGHTTCATSGLMYGCVAALIGIPCILSCGYRTKLRSRFGLLETPAPDWVTHCLCEWCALCQAYRELNLRGLDPSIGWQGNLAKSNMQQQPMGMMPPRNQTMNY